jgi:hypothetical protein
LQIFSFHFKLIPPKVLKTLGSFSIIELVFAIFYVLLVFEACSVELIVGIMHQLTKTAATNWEKAYNEPELTFK